MAQICWHGVVGPIMNPNFRKYMEKWCALLQPVFVQKPSLRQSFLHFRIWAHGKTFGRRDYNSTTKSNMVRIWTCSYCHSHSPQVHWCIIDFTMFYLFMSKPNHKQAAHLIPVFEKNGLNPPCFPLCWFCMVLLNFAIKSSNVITRHGMAKSPALTPPKSPKNRLTLQPQLGGPDNSPAKRFSARARRAFCLTWRQRLRWRSSGLWRASSWSYDGKSTKYKVQWTPLS